MLAASVAAGVAAGAEAVEEVLGEVLSLEDMELVSPQAVNISSITSSSAVNVVFLIMFHLWIDILFQRKAYHLDITENKVNYCTS